MREWPVVDALVAEGLVKDYRRARAVDGVSLRVRPGERVALLGPNGAGKTTTLRMLSTVVAPTRGQFRVAGVTRDDEVRKVVGVLPENAGCPGHQTGLEFLAYHARLHGLSRGEARERAVRLLGQVGLGDSGGARISTYSRGMRQRLGLARALVNDPAVVLLDEPTIGLDPPGQRDVLTLVRTIAEARGLTVLLATHAAPEVERICTGVLILERGRLVSNQVMT